MQIYQPSRLPPASNFRVCVRERDTKSALDSFSRVSERQRVREVQKALERLKKKRLAAVQHFHSVHP